MSFGIHSFNHSSLTAFTSLATAGGKVQDSDKTAHHPLISAAVIAAPWTGSVHDGTTYYAFGHENTGLSGISIPILTFFGSKDDITSPDFILPAVKI